MNTAVCLVRRCHLPLLEILQCQCDLGSRLPALIEIQGVCNDHLLRH